MSHNTLRFIAAVIATVGLAVTPIIAQAQGRTVPVPSGVQYELIASWSVERLNNILEKEFPEFAGIEETYTPAENAVDLYRVTYPSVIPEQGNRPTVASGLVAVPAQATGILPVVSYQHGTVYGKHDVPSFPEESPETLVMIAQFAGQGYVVIGADYFGMGLSTEPEGYMVKASHQQATMDMLSASDAILEDLAIERGSLFLAGWSQGGFVTFAFLESLEEAGIHVTAAATASAPVDLGATLRGTLFFPRDIDAPWIGASFILTSFAYEHYYGLPGLARSVIQDEHYEVARLAYEREPFDPEDLPTLLSDLVRPEYFDHAYFEASAFGRLASETQAYRRVIRTPMRNYYGEVDEAIPAELARLAMYYQRAMGAGNDKVEAISTGNTDHRGTYARAIPYWKEWFDSFLAQ